MGATCNSVAFLFTFIERTVCVNILGACVIPRGLFVEDKFDGDFLWKAHPTPRPHFSIVITIPYPTNTIRTI